VEVETMSTNAMGAVGVADRAATVQQENPEATAQMKRGATKPRQFPPRSSVEKLLPSFLAALVGLADEDRAVRAEWARLLAEQMVRIGTLHTRQAVARNWAHALARGAAGLTAIVTTLTGSALAAHVHGQTSAVIGWVAIAIGGIGAVIAATRPGQSYESDLVRSAQYEGLWWDIYAFGATKLATITPDELEDACNGFSDRQRAIASFGITAT
jgi:hypothetical protein